MHSSDAAEFCATQPVIAQPEPGLTAQMLVARAAALRPLLRESQEENDRRGYYSDAIHRKFAASGFYRVVQPRMFGGYEFDFVTFVKLIMEISRGHPATGWCYTLASSHAFLVGAHWPEEVQRELFGEEGDFRAAQKASPAGTFKRVDGGFVVDGVFSFCSGIPVATHFVGAGVVPAGDDAVKGIYFIVRRDQLTILSDWGGEASLGMQGSGSNSVKLAHVFVPDRHIVDSNMLLSSEQFPDGTPGTRLHKNPMYLSVIGGAYHCEFGAITTGAARAALDEYEQILRTRKTPGGLALKLNDPESQRAFGQAINLTDSAEALTLAAAQLYMDQCHRWAKDGSPITARDTLQVWGMAREACLMACEAVELLFQTAGATVCLSGQRLQRYFRDVQMYRIHVTAQPQVATMTAQTHLGLPTAFGSSARTVK